MRLFKESKEGFSLIEVIVAVAILAIVALPILFYFTDAAVHSAKGKNEQEANMAAQSVIEELDSVEDFGGIEDYLDKGVGSGWTVKNKAPEPLDLSDPSDATKVQTTLEKAGIDVDGHTYNANITIDYGAYPALTGSDGKVLQHYNVYDNPHFAELYSDSSVVASEGDQTTVGVNQLYYQLNKVDPAEANAENYHFAEKITKENIKSNMDRTFVLDVSTVPGSTDLLRVRAYYNFVYNLVAHPVAGVNWNPSDGSVGPTAIAVLKDTKVEKGKLENVFFMFKAMAGHSTEQASINISALGTEDAKKLKISFISQTDKTTGTDNIASGYKIQLGGDSMFDLAKYYTSGDPDHITLSGAVPNFSKGFIEKVKDKRMALVTVEVYRTDDSTKEILATSTTSKSI